MNLADLMKRFGLSAKEEKAQVDLKDTEELKQILEVLESNETALAEALVVNDELVAKNESLEKQLEQFAEAKAQAEAAAQEAIAKAAQEKADARMAKLSAEFGDEKAAKLMKVAEKMEDAEFSEVFGIQQELAAKEENSFAEQGIDAKVKEEKKPVHFKNFIKKQGK